MFDYLFFFFKQKTAYELRISDWSSDVCSSDLGIVGIVAGSVLTMAYSLRFAAVFWRRSGRDDADVPAPSWVFAAPVYVLSALTIAAGIVPSAVIGDLVDSAARGVLGAPATSELALWHGVNSALVLSVVTIAGGVLRSEEHTSELQAL